MNLSGEAKALIGIGAITLLLVGVAILLFSSSSESPLSKSNGGDTIRTIDQNILIKSDSPQIKVENSNVTIVEFLDPECESCRATYPTVKQVLQAYKGKINFVIRYFPLHYNSVLAAKAAEAAGEQGKYWEMLDMLFGKQMEWGEKQEPQTELFVSYAEALGLDTDKFRDGLVNKAYENKVARDKNDGISAGVNGTPTFFINGKLLGNAVTLEEFKSVIDPILNK